MGDIVVASKWRWRSKRRRMKRRTAGGQSGHNMTFESALAEMHGRTDPEIKRAAAERYRVEADRFDDEAKKLETELP